MIINRNFENKVTIYDTKTFLDSKLKCAKDTFFNLALHTYKFPFWRNPKVVLIFFKVVSDIYNTVTIF